jgi:hypothetical protein
VEHLTLLVGKKVVALAPIRHFGSRKGLVRVSFQELRQFLPASFALDVVLPLVSISVPMQLTEPSWLVGRRLTLVRGNRVA